MSNEITATFGLSVKNGKLNLPLPTEIIKINMTGTHMSSDVMPLDTTPQFLPISISIATAGLSKFKNVSATNTIIVGRLDDDDLDEYGASTFLDLIALKPGEMAIFRLSTLNVAAKTVSGTADLYFAVFEE